MSRRLHRSSSLRLPSLSFLAILSSTIRCLSYPLLSTPTHRLCSSGLHPRSSFLRLYSTSSPRMSSNPSYTPRILSIQSHTVHGFVGNKAVTFPLQTMGFDVNAINTITLSNHPAYSKGTKGQSLDADVLKQIIVGLEDNSLLDYDVVMTGYTRFVSHLEHISAAVHRIRASNPRAIFVCDPVLGDNDQYYVPSELTAKYQELLLPLATVVTPNIFESQVLSGLNIKTESDAIAAARKLHSLGPSIVVMTGLPITQPPQTEKESTQVEGGGDSSQLLSMLLSYHPSTNTAASHDDPPSAGPTAPVIEPIVFRIDVPRLEGYYAGCGDLFSAFTTSAIAHLRDHYIANPYLLGTALEYAAEAMAEVLEATKARKSRELRIVESRDVFIRMQEKLQRLAATSASPAADPETFRLEQSPPPYRATLVHHPKAIGVIFDMDGTLTEPHAIDFQAMYDRIGLVRSKDSDILSLVNQLPTEEERERAMEIIYDEEMRGIERQTMRRNMQQVIHKLYEAKMRISLCTRNCQQAYLQFLSQSRIHSHYFVPALFRESTNPELQKPNPALARHILSSWTSSASNPIDNRRYWFVGDSIDDMKCGKLAGLTTALILTDYNKELPIEQPELVDHSIHSLEDLLPLLLDTDIPPPSTSN